MSNAEAIIVGKERGLRGEITAPSDKSILHRLILFSAIAEGACRIHARTIGRDNLSTLRIVQQLGVRISASLPDRFLALAKAERILNIRRSENTECVLDVNGRGLLSLREPHQELDCGNSGTTARLLCGLLAGFPFHAKLTGDASLLKRPFQRVIDPLRQMGTEFSADKLPFTVNGQALRGIDYQSPQASAQVKSAVLLAGLHTADSVAVIEPFPSRDHTERLFTNMGCDVETEVLMDGRGRTVLPKAGNRRLNALGEITVAGDFSGAAFFIIAALIVDGSDVVIRNVGLNPTRAGLLDVLKRMGAALEVLQRSTAGGEDVADIRVRACELQGTIVSAREVAVAIDEIPILAVAAAFSNGETRIKGAAELRVKESDRLSGICKLLSLHGFQVEESADDLRIIGAPGRKWDGSECQGVSSFLNSLDHRMIMSAFVLELALRGESRISDLTTIETSFPDFIQCFQLVTVGDDCSRVKATFDI